MNTPLKKDDDETHRKGETLLHKQNIYRARVVCLHMAAKIPLSKLDCSTLKELLEENRFRVARSRHMMDLLPLVLQEKSVVQLYKI